MKTRFQLYLNRSGALAASWAERFLPDPWIYAVLLTVTAYCAALLLTERTPWEAARAWHDGLWNRSILTLVAQFSINLFVPSEGAQWIVSGPILVRTSEVFGYSAAQAVLIEVMWALPALSLAGLQARQIMGYTAVVMVFAFFVMTVGLTLLPA